MTNWKGDEVKSQLIRLVNAEWIGPHGMPVSLVMVSLEMLQAALERILELEKECGSYQGTETRTCIDCRNTYPEFGHSSHMRCWECRSQKDFQSIVEKADELVEVICHSAPTGWAASGDLVEASEWEKKACKAMNEYEAIRKLKEKDQ